MTVTKKLSLVCTTLLLLVFLSFPVPAHAASISIQPLRQELDLRPGQTATSTLVVRNTGKSDTTVKLSAESFNVVNENYDYSFSEAEDLKNWVHFKEPSALIKPGTSHDFEYSIGAPNQAEPGGKYIAIFSTVERESKSAITSIERAGLLIYVLVPGKVTKQGEILDWQLPKIVFSKLPNWNLRIHNSGNAHFNSKLTISVSTLWNHQVSQQVEDHLVLPLTIRHLDGPIELGRWPGLYKVKTTVGRGDLPAYQTTRLILYAPLLSIFIMVVLLVSFGKYILRRIRKIKDR